MEQARFSEDAWKLLDLVGGKENISSVGHCVTRMRFVLTEPQKAKISEIEELEAVKGTFTQAGQFQVIIGNEVKDFYNTFTSIAGIEGVSKDAVKTAAKQNQNPAQRVIGVLAEIFSPLIPAIVIGGLLLGFRNVLETIPLITTAAGKIPLIEASVFWNGVNAFLWLICEAIFHFLPVGITWSVTKKMGCTEILGIVLGLTLVSPQLLNAYAVASTAATDIPFWDFGFAQINMIGYQAQVIPAMLAAFLFCYLERFFRKVIPQAISMIFVPFFSLIPAVFLAHTVLGPFGWFIGSGISKIVFMGLSSAMNWLFGAVFGFLYAPLVITGLHHMTNAIDLQLMADYPQEDEKWALSNVDFHMLRSILHDWQVDMCTNNAWDALFWNNHDQPRALTRFASKKKEYHYQSATMLASTIHFMRGTPYVYMGEEIGMINPEFDDIRDYKDVETLNYYEILRNKKIPHEEVMAIIKMRSRDNSRTPMQWTSGPGAGFTKGVPWIKAADNKCHINVESETNKGSGILAYYKKLIALRKKYDIIQTGNYRPMLLEIDSLIAYQREIRSQLLICINNFSDSAIRIPQQYLCAYADLHSEVIISNYCYTSINFRGPLVMQPYESVAILLDK